MPTPKDVELRARNVTDTDYDVLYPKSNKVNVGLDRVENMTPEEIRAGTTKTHVGLANVDDIRQAPYAHVGARGTAHQVVTTTENGFMIAADKVKVDELVIEDGVIMNPPFMHPGFISFDDQAKLDTIEAYAQKNSNITKAEIEAVFIGTITSHSHSATPPQMHAASHVSTGSDTIPLAVANGASGLMSGTDKAKLDGVFTHNHSAADITSGTLNGARGVTAGTAASSFLRYNSNTKLAGTLYGGTTNPTATTRLNYDGYVYATRIFNAAYNDLAEFMEYYDSGAQPGDVMVQTKDGLTRCWEKRDGAVIGVYSDTYGYALGAENVDVKIPIGISGRVRVKLENTAVIGDLVVTGHVKGYAMAVKPREVTPGTVFGKVMENYTPGINEDDRAWILIMNA